MRLYLDIETLPAPPESEPTLRELYERRPGRASTFDDYLRGTSLTGNWGRILCIGIAQDDQPVEILQGEETAILATFWARAANAEQLVGHNAFEFDIPFLRKRSIVHRVQPSFETSQLRDPVVVYDTMREWGSGSHPFTGLHELAKILGLRSSKDGMDGSQVYDYWRAGRLQEIYDYCARDVEVTRAIHHRLTFRD